MEFRWSEFCLEVPLRNGNLLLKNTLTGAALRIDRDLKVQIDRCLAGENGREGLEEVIHAFASPDMAFLLPATTNEYSAWRERLVEKRNHDAHIFILHFLPTIQCQLECDYCFENGADRGTGMPTSVLHQSKEWLERYFTDHPEIDMFRLVVFGGEPLLRKDLARMGIEAFHAIACRLGLEFWCELTSNGELLDKSMAEFLLQHEWKRFQITLDGPREVHDRRRHGHHMRPTFGNIVRTLKLLLGGDYIDKVDVRISFDEETSSRISELISYLATLDNHHRINLSLGMITSTFAKNNLVTIAGTPSLASGARAEQLMAEKALEVWRAAKEAGFAIPGEFITGPWCVAIAKHSAVLQPDGSLQKCFCTSGRHEYNFGSVAESPGEYLKDARFEHFRRTDQCIEEHCQFLPMCGGGCIHDAVVAHGGMDGFDHRFCQKTLLKEMNEGLLRLNYG